MAKIRLLLAGPGTGKTTRIKELINGYDPQRILVVSFTNATINDLLSSFKKDGIDITSKNCMTLHKLALKLNHLPNTLHILNREEKDQIQHMAKSLGWDSRECERFMDCVDFNSMILDSIAYIETNPEFVKERLGEINLLIVDEFQDFNPDERKLISQVINLSGGAIILCDDDQCIYGFKNADSSGVINLYKDSTIEKIPHCNKCYRCPMDVVLACNNLIRNNKNRVPKELIPYEDKKGLVFRQTSDDKETIQFVLAEIEKVQKKNANPSIVILSSIGFVVKTLIDYLKVEGIEHSNMWEEKIDAELQRKIWELRTIFGSKKLLNTIFLSKLWAKGNPGRKKKLKKLMKRLFLLGEDKTVVFEELISLGVLERRVAGLVEDPPSIDQFFKDAGEYAFLSEFISGDADLDRELEDLEQKLLKPDDFKAEGINIMSIHKSKGLQANYVFILGLVDGILPKESGGRDSLEAQRRILFVGMSRVKDGLYLVSQIEWLAKDIYTVDKSKFKHFRKDRVKGQTSLFIHELQAA